MIIFYYENFNAIYTLKNIFEDLISDLHIKINYINFYYYNMYTCIILNNQDFHKTIYLFFFNLQHINFIVVL